MVYPFLPQRRACFMRKTRCAKLQDSNPSGLPIGNIPICLLSYEPRRAAAAQLPEPSKASGRSSTPAFPARREKLHLRPNGAFCIKESAKEVRTRLKNKTALITGGNSGIGLATARLFVAEGAKVAITGRNQSTLDAAVEELGSGLVAFQADMTDVAAIEKAVGAAVEKLGHLDILFANAGIAGATPVGKTSLDKFEEILKTNVTGVFFTIQAAVPLMSVGASIILNGSVLAIRNAPRMPPAKLVLRP